MTGVTGEQQIITPVMLRGGQLNKMEQSLLSKVHVIYITLNPKVHVTLNQNLDSDLRAQFWGSIFHDSTEKIYRAQK